jgi:hypothetical protein
MIEMGRRGVLDHQRDLVRMNGLPRGNGSPGLTFLILGGGGGSLRLATQSFNVDLTDPGAVSSSMTCFWP